MVGFKSDYKKIILMCPTYRRSDTYLPRYVETAVKTWTHGLVELMFCVNKNDHATKCYLNSKIECKIVEENLPRPNLAKFFNLMYDEVRDPGVVVTMLGDDMEFRTPGWDRRMLDLINTHKGVGVFWANDDYIARERMCVNVFVTSDFVHATEHPFMDERFEADMIDYLWHKVGQYTNTLHFDPDTHIFHNHNTTKPAIAWDATFKRLAPGRAQGAQVGKGEAKRIAAEIAEILKKKGLVGDSVC